MIIQPKVRGFICTAAHPLGCYKAVERQVDYVTQQGFSAGPKNVLIIGASTGYGLASAIFTTFANQANTVGVSYERPADAKRTASAGWYNLAAFEQLAQRAGRLVKNFNGDAFSQSMKQQVITFLKNALGPIDLLVYSVAAPRRAHPMTGEISTSVLKPIGSSYTGKTVDPLNGIVKNVVIEPATAAEIQATEAVMGGEDWEMWINQLSAAGLLAKRFMTVAYSYIGPELTHPIYKNGTIGRAKLHLQQTARHLNQRLSDLKGRALISVNKALVTQASSAIPVVPLYISLLYKLMKKRGTHEGCIEQISRLFRQRLYVASGPVVDENGYIRLDDWEMDPAIQTEITQCWEKITTENLADLTDIEGYRNDFYHLFGFGFEGIDYNAEVDPEVSIPSIGSLLIDS